MHFESPAVPLSPVPKKEKPSLEGVRQQFTEAGWKAAQEYLLSMRESDTMDALKRMLVAAVEECQTADGAASSSVSADEVAERLIDKGEMKQVVDTFRPRGRITESGYRKFYHEVLRLVSDALADAR